VEPATGAQYRMTFVKMGSARFLAHLDVSVALMRAFARSGISVFFSEGFHPHPRISFAFATPVGMESRGEYADILIRRALGNPAMERERLNAFLPAGIEVTELVDLPQDTPSLTEAIHGFAFSVALPNQMTVPELKHLEQKIADFLAVPAFFIVRAVKGKETRKEIRSFVDVLRLEGPDMRLYMELQFGVQGSVRPLDILTQVLGIPSEAAAILKTVKEKTFFKDDRRNSAAV